MSKITTDTTIDAAIKQLEILQRLNINDRADMTFQLSDSLRWTVEAGVRQRHPDFDEQTVKRAGLRLTRGERVLQQAYEKAEAKA